MNIVMEKEAELIQVIAEGDELEHGVFPELYNLSARFLYKFLPRPKTLAQPEFLYIPVKKDKGAECGVNYLRLVGILSQWNMAWEAAQLRQDMNLFFNEEDTVKEIAPSLSLLKKQNVYLLPDTAERYHAYLPLYALLPLKTLSRYGLPPIRRKLWPSAGSDISELNRVLPSDFRQRLAMAFASHIWPFLNSGSNLAAFDKNEPIRLIAHNLDFWLPHITSVAEDRMRSFDFVDFDDAKERRELSKIQNEALTDEHVFVDRCRKGGYVWSGEDDAFEATNEMIDCADRNGRLRSLMDAIRSNRVEEDFSDRWSFAREDFERKLYKKRQKISVKFVEMDQAFGVAGPESEFAEALLWQDFFAVLNTKEKQIVVCLRKGATNLTEVAQSLGYANHSPISKALARIRQKALKYLS